MIYHILSGYFNILKMNILNKILVALIPLLSISCVNKNKDSINEYSWIKNSINVASEQLLYQHTLLNGENILPRSTYTTYTIDFLCEQLEIDSVSVMKNVLPPAEKNSIGKLRCCDIYDWTSGFFPGSLWYAFELSGNKEVKELAIQYTNMLNPIRYYTDNHDIGFMINCSYGNAIRLAPNDTIKNVIIDSANSLCSRYNDTIGAIRSWDFGSWNYPVIIDNMMNLDLLFHATDISKQSNFKDVAVKHAKTTMKNHFRSDYTCWHVVSYNNDGTVESKQTYQGKNDDSAWARGQAWALYGFTSCFENTNDSLFLQQATLVADMIMERVTTDDSIPYWDYMAPTFDNTPRDASAAAITASGMLKLCKLTSNGDKYLNYAERILKNLSSEKYLATVGTNEGFILKQSTGSLPHGSEINTPINYADYYFLEALSKYMNLKALKYNQL